ncbi:hypothetical protein AGMMS50293_20010 [Spirochaetia bacterium]|nr:hypothetical protein AGMMS50293_20010 [Spirochaetia bacterium]
MNTILLFAVPPLAGALIGFVTNVIAIRMLFRPLCEIRVFGIRLPFTPGILPRQRHKLAESIGAMVERELLTPELLRQRLRREEVREKLRQHLSPLTEKMLAAPLDDLFAAKETGIVLEDLLKALHNHVEPSVRGRIAGKLREAAEQAYPGAAASLIGFLRRADIHRELEAQGSIFLGGVMLKLNALQRFFLSAGQYDQTLHQRMPEIIDDLVDQVETLLRDTAIRDRLLKAAEAAIVCFLSGDKPPAGRLLAEILKDQSLGSLLSLSAEKKQALDDLLCSRLLLTVDEQIENLLASLNVRVMVSERIDSLDMIRVERIILDVMANQFKWIDIFGGILGFLIGAFQAVFSWALR